MARGPPRPRTPSPQGLPRAPRLAQLLASAHEPLPSESRISEIGLGLLREAGLPDAQAVQAFQAIESYTAGTSSLDATAGPDSGEAWRRAFAALPPDEYPNLSSVAPLMYLEDETGFEFGLDLMIDAIQARAAATGS